MENRHLLKNHKIIITTYIQDQSVKLCQLLYFMAFRRTQVSL